MKTIFWNVDTQYDFMRDDETHKGALVVPDAKTIESNLEMLTKYASKKGIQVVNTADWHTPDSKEFSETPDYKTTFPPHCLAGTKGAEYVPATTPKNAHTIDWKSETIDEKTIREHKGDYIILKDDFCVFKGNRHTNRLVELIKPEQAIVYGVATNVCVNYAVLGLLERGVSVRPMRRPSWSVSPTPAFATS